MLVLQLDELGLLSTPGDEYSVMVASISVADLMS